MHVTIYRAKGLNQAIKTILFAYIMKFKQKLSVFFALVAILVAGVPQIIQKANAQVVNYRTIFFPVIGKVSYYDDFGAPRVGHTHEGNDLMGKKNLPLVAVVDGTITNVNYPEESWGYSVTIRDSDGYRYNYLHMNNDNPGTDDGKGDGMNAYAPDIQEGNKVVKGQLIGWMGDSGNAEGATAHLHFEIKTPDGVFFSPYSSLQAATKITTPVTDYPAQQNEILPYGDFKGGANVASGNVDSDSVVEIVSGAVAGGGPLVKVMKRDGTVKAAWYAYADTFRGGVDVATGDIDKDGQDEIITAAGTGGGPHIKIFKSNGTLFKELMAYDPKFHGGVKVATTDLDNDGAMDIITGPGHGGGPDVRVFSGTTLGLIKEFMAYDPKFHGGIDVAGVPKNTTGTSPSAVKIITAPLAGGGPHIKFFDANANTTKEFFAYAGNFNLGLRISTGVINSGSSSSDVRVAVMPATGGGPNLKTFTLVDGSQRSDSFVAFEEWWRGGYDVTLIEGSLLIASVGGRRTSLRITSPNSSNNNGGNGGGGFGGGFPNFPGNR